jgi:osmotically inducible lipoprotein OsmB
VFLGSTEEIDMRIRFAAMLALSTLLCACASGPLSGREKGALAGGALGAGAGAIIGNQVHHHSAAGAAIGGAAGALGGAIIGDQSDAAAERRYYDR